MNTLFGGPDTPSGDIPPLPQNPDQIMAGFKKMAEAAAMTLSGENSANDDEVSKYSDSISQALKVIILNIPNSALYLHYIFVDILLRVCKKVPKIWLHPPMKMILPACSVP